MLSPGTLVGPYRVVEHVGAEGTMAEVYRAEAAGGRTVAVKLLGPPTAQAQREADVVTRLDHPGIVTTFEVITWEERLCLVQEWVDGPSLATVLDAEGRLSFLETVRLGQAVGKALAYAHDRGILHRDIKPSNVLRTTAGEYKLVDFGAVGLLEPDGQTRTGEIVGTPLYMAPEQGVGGRQSPATDVFGLGLLLFRAMYGYTPGESAHDYTGLVLQRSIESIAVPPSPFREIIERCLAIESADRPRSSEVVRALNQLMGPPGNSSPPPFAYNQDWGPTDRQQAPWAKPIPWEEQAPWEQATVWRKEAVWGEHAQPRYSAMARRRVWPGLAAALVVVAVVVVAWVLAPDPAELGFWLRLGAGIAVIGAALLVARQVRRLTSRAPDTERQAAGILTGAGGRDALTRSMVLEVDQVVAKLKGLDAKFLGYTMVMLIREAEQARESADRVAALVQMVTLMEKLMKQLSPWHVRHKEAIATVIAIVGSLVGVASVVSGFLR